jgi:hypothetical protein
MARIGDKLGVRATNVIGVAARFRTEPVRRLVVEEATPQLDRLGDLVWLHTLHTFATPATALAVPRAVWQGARLFHRPL